MDATPAARGQGATPAAYGAFRAECPTRRVLDTLGNKWVGLILGSLAEGPQRYSYLSTRIAGVSQKMLTQTLRILERDGLITRTVTPQVPIRVDYALTDLGVSLVPLLAAIRGWAESHMDDVIAARDGVAPTVDPAPSSPESRRRQPPLPILT